MEKRSEGTSKGCKKKVIHMDTERYLVGAGGVYVVCGKAIYRKESTERERERNRVVNAMVQQWLPAIVNNGKVCIYLQEKSRPRAQANKT
jgi:hypothetical protein